VSFARLQKIVTYLLAAFGLITLGFGGEIPLPALGALALGYASSWWAEGALLQKRWWSQGITVALAVLLVVQILRGLLTGGWLGLAMEFSGVLSISRLANRRTAADYQQIAMLAFIQLIAATVLTTDLGYAGVFLAFAVVTPWVLTFAHLRREIERNYPAESDVDGGNDVRRVLSSKRIVDPGFLLWTALLSVPMLVITVALFALFPRIGLGMLNIGSNRTQHVSGFGNNVELGGFGLIRDDPTVVVRVSSPIKLDPITARKILRLRGTAFDRYDGRTWTRSESDSVRMSPLGEYYPLQRMEHDGDLTLRLILDHLDETVLFVPAGTVGLRIPQRGVPGTARERMTISRGHGFDIRYQSHEELGVIYEAVISPQAAEHDVPVDRDLDDERYLALPAGHERLIALARELTANLTDQPSKAKRLLSYLRNEGRYRYSLELPNIKGVPPLLAFVFDAKRGHCEYFSSALAIMLRAVGIPSRNVTGFAGGEYNGYGGYYAVRQADAHSWVEALLPGRGWVTMDPTPATRDALSFSSVFDQVRAMVDAARAYWMTRVVSYDLRAQVRAVRSLRDFFRDIHWPSWGRSNDDQAATARGLNALPELRWVALIAIVMVAAVIAIVFRSRRGSDRNRLSRDAIEAQRLYRELEQVLARRGKARPTHVTPEAHARSLQAAGFEAAPAVLKLTDAYVRARYGEQPLQPTGELEQLLRDVKRAA
jgi:transglutaminase-like putative cysteine protease